jgi:hypothetical protein
MNPQNRLNWNWILGLILFVLTLIIYQPAWDGTPIWDNDAHITKPELRSVEGHGRIWTEFGALTRGARSSHSNRSFSLPIVRAKQADCT